MKHSAQLLAVMLATVGATWATDPIVGTWNLNVARSKYIPGPAPKSQTRIYEEDAAGVKATVKTVSADGTSFTIQYPANYDGKEYAVSGSADTDGILMKKVNDHTAESTLMHAGIVIGTARRIISDDGKTMTITYQGTMQGEKVNNMGFYEKKIEK